MANQTSQNRGWFLTVMTVLFVILALSDFTKALQFLGNPERGGLVMFGHKFQGVAPNLIFGPLVGIVLVTYAIGIWNMRAWVLPIAFVYAFYVPVNMVMFWSLHVLPPPTVSFIVVYLAIALTGSVGTALYLAWNRERLN